MSIVFFIELDNRFISLAHKSNTRDLLISGHYLYALFFLKVLRFVEGDL